MAVQNHSQDKFILSVWFPAGIVLLVLGILTLATPLFTQLEINRLLLDIVAGWILSLAGIWGIVKG